MNAKRTALGMAAAIAALASCNPTDHHGAPFTGAPKVEIGALVDQPAAHVKKGVLIEGTISNQCPATGCWFQLQDAQGKQIKVDLGDTLPKLPQRTGKKAVVEGQLIKYGDGYQFVGKSVEFR